MLFRPIQLLLSATICMLFSCFGPFDPNNPYQGSDESDPGKTINQPLADSSILAFWDFDDSGTTVLEDISDYNNHGIIDGCKWVPGIKGNALSFDGTDDYVEIGKYDQFNLGLKEFTVSLFVKVNTPAIATDSFHYDIISKGERCKSGFTVSVENNKVLGQIKNMGCSNNDSTLVTDGNWHHIVLLRRSGKGYLYFDAKSVYNYACNDTISTLTKLKFGKNGVMDDEYYSGLLDEVKIINKGWTEAEVKAEFDRCF